MAREDGQGVCVGMTAEQIDAAIVVLKKYRKRRNQAVAYYRGERRARERRDEYMGRDGLVVRPAREPDSQETTAISEVAAFDLAIEQLERFAGLLD